MSSVDVVIGVVVVVVVVLVVVGTVVVVVVVVVVLVFTSGLAKVLSVLTVGLRFGKGYRLKKTVLNRLL